MSTLPIHRLIVHTGPMFSAKTLHLISFYRTLLVGNQRVVAFRPTRDTRDDEGFIRTRMGDVRIPATMIERSDSVFEFLDPLPDYILFDEGQFFDSHLPDVISRLLQHSTVVVSGLDLDYRGQPFGPMPSLLALAHEVHKHAAACTKCGAPTARFTQRLRDGEPSLENDLEVVPDGKDAAVVYEPRCTACFVRVS